MRFFCLVAFAICAAVTPAAGQGTEEQREACTPDALKLCSDTIPDVDKTTACMKLHLTELSPRCRAVVGGAAPPPAAPATIPAQSRQPDKRPVIRPVGRLVPPRRAGADPDAEVPYVPPRRVIAPPLYGEPGPVIFPKAPLPDGSFCSPPYDFCEPDILDDWW